MEFIWIFLNVFYNVINIILHLFPFGIFDNIWAFFPAIYTNGIMITAMFFISVVFGYMFFVYFAGILTIPIEDDVKWTDDNKKAYRRTFLGQTIRFILWSKNVVTYSGIFVKYIGTLWVRLLPFLLILAFLYFPFMPNTKWFYTVGQYSTANSEIIKQSIMDMMTWDFSWSGSQSQVNAQYGKNPITPGWLRDPAERKKYMITSYQNNVNVKHEASKELAKYAHVTDIWDYEKAIDGYINANMSTLMQSSENNKQIEQQKQVIYAVLDGMDRQLEDYKQRAAWKQSVQLFWWKVIYTWLNLSQFWFVFSIINGLLALIFVIFLLLLSWWKNLVLLYLYAVEMVVQKFEWWKDKESMKKLMATNLKLKEIWPDVKEWEYVVQNGQNKELYFVLILEVLIRMLIVYYIFFF